MWLNIRLNLTSERVNLHVLEGLDNWVKLGLLSEAQVRELAQVMSEPIPTVTVDIASTSEALRARDRWPDEEALAANAAESSDRVPVTPKSPSQISRSLNALLDEISVIWLLFLGVFLVIVSSGVLAATQWQSFSAVGQYAILLGYTLAFWGASLWAKQQETLQTTARMLVLTTLLLIPVNFWMMDALGVLSSLLGKGAGGIAAIALSCLPLSLLHNRANRLNLIGLSWLHWGWAGSSLLGVVGGWSLWPVVATYVGTVGTAMNLTRQDRPSMVTAEDEEPEAAQASSRRLPFDVLTVALAVLILLFRSLFIAQVPPHQLGLAAGICGWLLAWLNRNQMSQAIWQWVGMGLMLLGWAVSVTHQPPWQAIGVSFLALGFLWDRLKLSWKKEFLLALIGVSGQAYWLLGALIPPGTRESVLTQLARQLSTQPIVKSEWTSLGFFPFLLGLLWFARQFRRWQKPVLSQTTEKTALVLGGGLSLLSLSHPFTAATNLLLSAAVLLVIVHRRPQITEAMVALSHVVGLIALAAWIDYGWPELSVQGWGYVGLGMAIAEFSLHLTLRAERWRRSTWAAGFGLFTLSYLPLLYSWDDHPDWVWLVVPVTLTYVVQHRRSLAPEGLAKATAMALFLQVPWLEDWPITIVSFAIGTLCLLINSRTWQSLLSAMLTVGSGVALVASSLWYVLVVLPGANGGRLLIIWAIVIWALWLLARALTRPLASGLQRRSTGIALYQRASHLWGGALMIGLLGWESVIANAQLWSPLNYCSEHAKYISYALAASVLLMAALLEAIRYQATEWRYWSLAWAGAIAMTTGLTLQGANMEGVAIAALALGLMTQIAGDLWVMRQAVALPYRQSWHGIPLAYGILGLMLGHSLWFQVDSAFQTRSLLQADTGLYTLFAAIIAIGVGRRPGTLRLFSYVGLAALSISAYELLIYQLLQASGGQPGDGMTLLAALALAIALAERGLAPWLTRYVQISAEGLSYVSHTHWAIGIFGVMCAIPEGMSQPQGFAIWTGTALLLACYALMVGNRLWTPQTSVGNHTVWTTVGLLTALLCIAHIRFDWFWDRAGLFSWGGVIACAIGFALYAAPWTQWGWPAKPWRCLGLWLPILTLSITLTQVTTQGLLMVGAFYAWMAKQWGQIRISYLTVILFDWALLRYLDTQGLLTGLWVSLAFGLSALYVVQIDPWLKEASQRQRRHSLRMMSIGLIGLTALYQADISDPMLVYAALTLALSMVSMFAGLIFKIRAFLYVGTATFVLQIVRVLWRSIGTHASLLWAVGIVLGMLFIWVAATFESRRSQITTLLESWSTALQTWD